jgi:sulfite reductase (NADPH) hemoprotein beta-component
MAARKSSFRRNKWFLGLFIENGKVLDYDTQKIKTGLKEVAKIHDGDFRLTGNQNLIIGNVSEKKK